MFHEYFWKSVNDVKLKMFKFSTRYSRKVEGIVAFFNSWLSHVICDVEKIELV